MVLLSFITLLTKRFHFLEILLRIELFARLIKCEKYGFVRMVEWFCKPKTDSLLSLGSPSIPSHEPPPAITTEPSFYTEPDRIAGLGPRSPTPEDELVTLLLGSMAGFIMKKCESQDCLKEIRIVKSRPVKEVVESEEDDEEEMVLAAEPKTQDDTKTITSSGRRLSKRKSKIGKGGHSPSEKKRTEHAVVKEMILEEEPAPLELEEATVSLAATTNVKQGKAAEEDADESEEFVEMEEQEEEALSPEEKKQIEKAKIQAEKIHMDRILTTRAFEEQDQMVEIEFINNNRYVGRLSRMEMEDSGKFMWSNGQCYKGTFKRNQCDGDGLIEWNGGESIYEGQVSCNLRNGFGTKTFVDLGERMYHVGEWKNGKKHGQGKSVYGEGSWYEGDWEEGKRHGVGTRFYANGARYHGQWYRGVRHGRGTMVWPNNDVYMGEWNYGQMHGMGKYTWNSSMNETVVPVMRNTYTGQWCQNKRHGAGVLELMCGAIIKTSWYDGMKSGSCDVICRNGNVFSVNDLFHNDRVDPVSVNQYLSSRNENTGIKQVNRVLHRNYTKIRFHNDNPAEDLKLSDTSFKVNDISVNPVEAMWIPINAPLYEMDLSWHIDQLFKVENRSLLYPTNTADPAYPKVPSWERNAIVDLETKWLRKVIIQRMADLTKIYNFYSLVLNDLKIPEHKYCMQRMCLWLLLKHCRLSETGLTVAKMDAMIGYGTDPFDKVMIHEMVSYLLVLSWYLYVPVRRKNPVIDGIIAACFDRFIEEVVNLAPTKYDGNFFKYLKFVPFESLWLLYSSFTYPMHIEDLCARLLNPTEANFQDRMPFTPLYYRYILQGKNIVGPDDRITYVPFEEANFDLSKMKLREEELKPADLRTLGLIGISNIIRCIKEAVPEAINRLTDELDGEFELSFNDFCDVLVNLITVYLDMSEDYYRKIVDLQDAQLTGKPVKWTAGADPAPEVPVKPDPKSAKEPTKKKEKKK